MSRERPILFSAPMVRAILAGEKTQTRRVVKPVGRDGSFVMVDDGDGWWPWRSDDGESSVRSDGDEAPIACPHGKTGDLLWVREAWRIGAWDENSFKFAIDYCDGPIKRWRTPANYFDEGELLYRLWQQSTDDARKVYGPRDRYAWEPGQSPCRWRPSIHMPRWASRITLEVAGVRVERLQDISEADAMAEGAAEAPTPMALMYSSSAVLATRYREGFAALWESINGPGSWDANPWVWVVEFRRREP